MSIPTFAGSSAKMQIKKSDKRGQTSAEMLSRAIWIKLAEALLCLN